MGVDRAGLPFVVFAKCISVDIPHAIRYKHHNQGGWLVGWLAGWVTTRAPSELLYLQSQFTSLVAVQFPRSLVLCASAEIIPEGDLST